MNVDAPELRLILERLDAVERQNRRMKRTGMATAGIIAAIVLMGQAQPETPPAPKKNKVVEAEQFIVRDAKGRQRGLFGLDHPESPGHSPVRIGLYNEGSSSAAMYLSDGFGGVTVTSGGEDKGPRRSVQLFANPQEGTGLKVGKTGRQTGVLLQIDPRGTVALSMKDNAGKVVFSAP
jgi:hypothetical protein